MAEGAGVEMMQAIRARRQALVALAYQEIKERRGR